MVGERFIKEAYLKLHDVAEDFLIRIVFVFIKYF